MKQEKYINQQLQRIQGKPAPSDKQVNYHVNFPKIGTWLRGQPACVRADKIHCLLGRETYDLVESYSHSPHLLFIKCKSDQELARFAEKWGPIYLTQAQLARGVSEVPIEHYRVLRSWLRAVVYLMDAYRGSVDDDGRECRRYLEGFFLAERLRQHYRKDLGPVRVEEIGFHLQQAELGILSDEPINSNFKSASEEVPKMVGESWLEFCIRGEYGIAGDTGSWIRGADVRMVRGAVQTVLRHTSLVLGVYLDCGERGGKPHIEARWTLGSLEQALSWMVWYDVLNQHSLLFCRNEKCCKPFRAESAHRRKYCSEECAHRVAARNWRRKDLEEKKKQT
jgi:hypothetical protein